MSHTHKWMCTLAHTHTHWPILRKAAYSWNAVSCGLQRQSRSCGPRIYCTQSMYKESSGARILCLNISPLCFSFVTPQRQPVDTREKVERQATLTNIFISLTSFALSSFISSRSPPLPLPPVGSAAAALYSNCKGKRRNLCFLLLEFSADSANCQLVLWTKK